jgi:hypothetical protein
MISLRALTDKIIEETLRIIESTGLRLGPTAMKSWIGF